MTQRTCREFGHTPALSTTSSVFASKSTVLNSWREASGLFPASKRDPWATCLSWLTAFFWEFPRRNIYNLLWWPLTESPLRKKPGLVSFSLPQPVPHTAFPFVAIYPLWGIARAAFTFRPLVTNSAVQHCLIVSWSVSCAETGDCFCGVRLLGMGKGERDGSAFP